ncbi:RusA family crossover junction endodeoxyribonuclease [Leuconostoc mesenteroides]|uniref:RusA family crossover junction endodeoxyribonuclease n=1 Tax=Leuconostoc mesenteroides TaxID=1245 RepID=UPI00123A76D7|nr:RusA family crossover junction endodeoxyribonuclease [Leuconostoc mesenteroides]KAA8346596.1 RusA family crossover junction endodeoxyribonuclease [Leuconostoc mesenteroides]
MFKFETELTVNPAPHNQSNFNPRTRQVFKGVKEKAYIADLEVRLRANINRSKFKKFGPQPIKVDYVFGFMPPQSWSKKRKLSALKHEIYPTSTQLGDWDNLCKSTQDRLNALIIEDDRFIVDGRGRKIYTEKPYLKIEIEEIEQ